MKNIRVLLLFVGVLMIGLGPSLTERVRAQSNQAAANASANVVKPIKLDKLWPLSFGILVPTSAAGAVQMVVSDLAVDAVTQAYINRTPTPLGGVTVLANQEGGTAPGPAIFKASGAKDYFFGITLPNNILVQLSTTDVVADPLLLDNFISNIGLSGQLTGGIGQMYFAVGATLHLEAHQAAGSYTGDFPVTVFYN